MMPAGARAWNGLAAIVAFWVVSGVGLLACEAQAPERRAGSGRAPAGSERAPAENDGREVARNPASAAAASPIPARSSQLVVGVAESWEATDVELALYERDASGAWVRRGEPWPGSLGKSGSAWGRGLHGDGAPPGRSGPVKREGDGTSPAGVFALTRAFGYAASGPGRMPYTQATRAWRCIDDPGSSAYNRIIDITGRAVDWTSSERMRRDDGLYEWVLEVAHNLAQPSPESGSCIFLHVWRTPGSPTIGCTAMARDRIESLLAALDSEKEPVFALLPREHYTALAAAWKLPALAP